MKILVIPAWYPQNEKDITASFFREQAHAFADAGYDVTVLHIEYLSVKKAFRNPWVSRKVWIDGNVRTVFVKAIIPIPMQFVNPQEKYISKLFEREIKREISISGRPDIIHAHVSHSCGYYCLNASKKLKLPLIVTEHYSGLLLGTATEDDYRRVNTTMEKADAFVFVGTNFRNSLCDRFGISRDKTYVIHNMVVMPETFSVENIKKEKKTGEPFTFLTACHLKKHKSVDLVIKAFHEEFSQDENVRLMIAGDGPERKNLEELIADLKENRIVFYGKYDRNEMPSVFSMADAFVLVDEVETFGIVYVEAMMCGLPCIGTLGQGGEDIINDGNGIKVEFGNVKKIRAAMRLVLLNHEKYDKIAICSQCISLFSPNKIKNKYELLYKKITWKC